MKHLLALLLLLPTFYISSTLADSRYGAYQPSVQPARPVILVTIQRLTGIGPDGREHVLFKDNKGFVTTLDTLGRVGYQVSANGLAEGGYHTLFVELADNYQLNSANGEVEEKRFSDSGQETKRRIRGMIMVRKGKANPLRMLESPSYYGTTDSGNEWDDD